MTAGAQDLGAAWREAHRIKGPLSVLGKQAVTTGEEPVPKITFFSFCLMSLKSRLQFGNMTF